MLARLNVSKGDALYADARNGGRRLSICTPYDPAFAEKMAKAEEIMKRAIATR